MQITGTTRKITYDGHDILFMNQRSPEWTHPYAYTGESENMHDAACGIFSIAHASQWMTGNAIDAVALADFACACGGRGCSCGQVDCCQRRSGRHDAGQGYAGCVWHER